MRSNRKVNSILKDIEKSKNTIPTKLKSLKDYDKISVLNYKDYETKIFNSILSIEKDLTEYENQISRLKNFDTSKMKVDELTEFKNLGVTEIESTYEELKKQSYDAIYELQIRIKELKKKMIYE